MSQLTYTIESIRESLRSHNSPIDSLYLLEKIEREILELGIITNNSTVPQLDTVGQVCFVDKSDLDITCLFSFFTPSDTEDFVAYPTEENAKDFWEDYDKLCKEWEEIHVLSHFQKIEFEEKYKEEIARYCNIHEILVFIHSEIEYHKNLYIKYPKSKSPIDTEIRINWLYSFTDFAYLIDKLKSKGAIRSTYKNILGSFLIEGEIKTEKQLRDLISKIKKPGNDNQPSKQIQDLLI